MPGKKHGSLLKVFRNYQSGRFIQRLCPQRPAPTGFHFHYGNIAEGFEREGNKEFKQFLAIAKGSVGEVKAQLYVALDASLINAVCFDKNIALADETARLLAGFLRYLKASDHKGSKFI